MLNPEINSGQVLFQHLNFKADPETSYSPELERMDSE